MENSRMIVIDGHEVIVDGRQIKLDTLDLYFGPERPPAVQVDDTVKPRRDVGKDAFVEYARLPSGKAISDGDIGMVSEMYRQNLEKV